MKKHGCLVFLVPPGSKWQDMVSWCYHNVCFKPSPYCCKHGGNTYRIRHKSPFRNNAHFSASHIPICTQFGDVFSPTESFFLLISAFLFHSHWCFLRSHAPVSWMLDPRWTHKRDQAVMLAPFSIPWRGIKATADKWSTVSISWVSQQLISCTFCGRQDCGLS